MQGKIWERYVSDLSERLNDSSASMPKAFSRQDWSALSATGIFTFTDHVDKEIAQKAEQLRELGKVATNRGLSFSAATQLASSIFCLFAFGNDYLKGKYLPGLQSGDIIGGHAITEVKAGSDVAGMSTIARFVDGEYILEGDKVFITNAPIADVLIIYAKVMRGEELVGISPFLVETRQPGVHCSPPMETAGLQSSPIGEVDLKRVPVPEKHRIGHEGAGMLILDQVMKREILLAFSVNIGEMEQRLSKAVKFVNERTQFGKSLGSNQLVADRIVDMQIAIELGSALLEKVARNIEGYEDLSIPTIAAKIFISDQNCRSALDMVQLYGARGYLLENGLTSALLDAVPGAIYSGSNGTLRAKMAKLLGVHG